MSEGYPLSHDQEIAWCEEIVGSLKESVIAVNAPLYWRSLEGDKTYRALPIVGLNALAIPYGHLDTATEHELAQLSRDWVIRVEAIQPKNRLYKFGEFIINPLGAMAAHVELPISTQTMAKPEKFIVTRKLLEQLQLGQAPSVVDYSNMLDATHDLKPVVEAARQFWAIIRKSDIDEHALEASAKAKRDAKNK